MGRISCFVQYDEKRRMTSTYSRMTDDVLFQMIPDHFQLPVFLSTDETGVYYYVPNGNLSELKYFMEENNISEEVVNRENIKKLDNDSNPVILYYEYKD